MRVPLSLLAVVVCGCGSGSSAGDGGVAADAATWPDAGPSCGATWRLVDVAATQIALIDPAPVTNARSVRVVVTAEMSGCQQLAPPTVSFAFEAEDAIVQMRAWQAEGTACTQEIRSVDRPVTMVLPRPGSWTVRAAGGPSVAIEVGLAPSRPCNPGGGGCEMDCDCAAGERCLGGNGFGGPFLACATPCEVDRDCLGEGVCISVADGLSWACETVNPECIGTTDCPAGFGCVGGVCTADYSLGQASRIPCDCDDECEPGLRCVEAQRPGERRCEVACPTATSAFCTAGHRCGSPDEDIAGLAASDAVCIWDGE